MRGGSYGQLHSGPKLAFRVIAGHLRSPADRCGRFRTPPPAGPSLDPQRRIAASRASVIAHYGHWVGEDGGNSGVSGAACCVTQPSPYHVAGRAA
jgi:hypothetical protein